MAGVQTVAISMSVCVYVHITVRPQISVPVAVAPSSSNDNAICYVLPVLCMQVNIISTRAMVSKS